MARPLHVRLQCDCSVLTAPAGFEFSGWNNAGKNFPAKIYVLGKDVTAGFNSLIPTADGSIKEYTSSYFASAANPKVTLSADKGSLALDLRDLQDPLPPPLDTSVKGFDIDKTVSTC